MKKRDLLNRIIKLEQKVLVLESRLKPISRAEVKERIYDHAEPDDSLRGMAGKVFGYVGDDGGDMPEPDSTEELLDEIDKLTAVKIEGECVQCGRTDDHSCEPDPFDEWWQDKEVWADDSMSEACEGAWNAGVEWQKSQPVVIQEKLNVRMPPAPEKEEE